LLLSTKAVAVAVTGAWAFRRWSSILTDSEPRSKLTRQRQSEKYTGIHANTRQYTVQPVKLLRLSIALASLRKPKQAENDQGQASGLPKAATNR